MRGFGSKDNKSCLGIQEIKSKIEQENKRDRYQGIPFVLYTHIPMFNSADSTKSQNYFTPYLVDSPGVEEIKNDVESYYRILCTMIYVENYQR